MLLPPAGGCDLKIPLHAGDDYFLTSHVRAPLTALVDSDYGRPPARPLRRAACPLAPSAAPPAAPSAAPRAARRGDDLRPTHPRARAAPPQAGDECRQKGMKMLVKVFCDSGAVTTARLKLGSGVVHAANHSAPARSAYANRTLGLVNGAGGRGRGAAAAAAAGAAAAAAALLL